MKRHKKNIEKQHELFGQEKEITSNRHNEQIKPHNSTMSRNTHSTHHPYTIDYQVWLTNYSLLLTS